MKIVHIVTRFKVYTGGEHHAFRFITEGVARGHTITVVTRDIAFNLMIYIPGGVEVKTLNWAHKPTRFHLLESMFDLLYSIFLFLIVPRDSDIDIYWNNPTAPAMLIDSVLRPSKKRLMYVLCTQEWAYGYVWKTAMSYPPLSWLIPICAPVYRVVDRLIMHRMQATASISDTMIKDLKTMYGLKQVFKAPPGIDIEREPFPHPLDVRKELEIGTDFVIMTTGKLIPKKNFDMFIDISKIVSDWGLEVTGVIVGDGPLKDALRKKVDRQNLGGKIIFTGHVTTSRVLQLMHAADVYLYLERRVPFGLTVVEAGVAGVPVIAFKSGGVDETIKDGKNGYSLPVSFGASEVSEKVAELLRRPAHERELLGKNGRAMALAQTWDRCYNNFIDILETLQDNRKSA